MIKHKLLFGICGIGRGHIYRQLPIIEHFAKFNKIGIFAFGESYIFFNNYFRDKKNIKIFMVSVPWVHGGANGINYQKTANEKFNLGQNFVSINFSAMDDALKFMGKPDLVISDYEPVSAQFAYSLNAKFITIDQQSKYFYRGYPKKIGKLSVNEEISRLNLFFPKAKTRIACSFFKPPQNSAINKVVIFPSVIREEIISLKNNRSNNQNKILVYLSPYSQFVQNADEVLSVFYKFRNINFYLFVSKESDFFEKIGQLPENIKIYFHGDRSFTKILGDSAAAICTSGHTFISEMMFLEKPVYTIPLNTYEQKYNAEVILKNKFGVSYSKIDKKFLENFLKKIPRYRKNIIKDNKILLNKNSGHAKIIARINKLLTQYE
jgi:uncharacterized protein (TIGR00661 family)